MIAVAMTFLRLRHARPAEAGQRRNAQRHTKNQ